jgi:putative ABC transport system substrate-binding protein
MRRREFITLIGGAGVTWPLRARAQKRRMPVIGFLHPGSDGASAHIISAFRLGLAETGYVEGRDVEIEFRWAQNINARLPELAADLVRLKVAVIATPASTTAAFAAKAATTTIPIVFSGGGDPVRVGLVASLNRPGGNATGVSGMNVELGAKRLELVRELLPAAERFVLLVNPNANSAVNESGVSDLRAAASALGRQIEVLSAGTPGEIDTAFATLAQTRPDVLLVYPDTMFINHGAQLAALAARYAIPAIYPFREDVEAGGLMSYGASITDNVRLVGVLAGRILKGEKPDHLPVMQPTKFELVINLGTAKALGLTVPPTLLSRADQVIE